MGETGKSLSGETFDFDDACHICCERARRQQNNKNLDSQTPRFAPTPSTYTTNPAATITRRPSTP